MDALHDVLRRLRPDLAVVRAASTGEMLQCAVDEHFEMAAVYYDSSQERSYGAAALEQLVQLPEAPPVVAVSGHGNVDIVADAVRAGANNFLVLGGQLEERVRTLLGKLDKLAGLVERNRRLREQYERLQSTLGERHSIIGESHQMLRLLDIIRRLAIVPRPCLIVGERGAGKELVARAIHHESDRRNGPLVTINCAAAPAELLESELFGHERGAYTGADRMAAGKFEQANGGTLFLDEIGAMSMPFQQKILRAVEYGVITRIGGTKEIPVRARIIAATNADIPTLMEQGQFLRDLYDRLAFEVVRVPPLRERAGDIELLALHFLNRFMQEIPAFRGKRLSNRALDALRRYSFPGNVRELKNIIERAAYRDTTEEISPEDLGLREQPEPGEEGGDFHQRVEAFRKRLIRQALKDSTGNQAAAARSLGLSYHQFRYLMKSMGVHASE